MFTKLTNEVESPIAFLPLTTYYQRLDIQEGREFTLAGTNDDLLYTVRTFKIKFVDASREQEIVGQSRVNQHNT